MRKRLLIATLALAGACLLGLATLPFLLDANRYRAQAQSQLQAKLNRPVTIGFLETPPGFRLCPIEAHDVAIGEDPTLRPLRCFL